MCCESGIVEKRINQIYLCSFRPQPAQDLSSTCPTRLLILCATNKFRDCIPARSSSNAECPLPFGVCFSTFGTTLAPYVWAAPPGWTVPCKHQVLVEWEESAATSSKRTATQNWAVSSGAIDGRDAKLEPESSVLVEQDYPRWLSWNLTELVQAWVNRLKRLRFMFWTS